MKTILKDTCRGIRGLFLFALLLLLYCTIGTLAVMEHHRCIFHLMPQYLAEGTAISEMPQPVSTATKPPPRSNPAGAWAPIRIKFFGKEIQFGNKFCSHEGTSIEGYFDSERMCENEDVLSPEKQNILTDKILPGAIKLHSERLLVQRLKGPIRVPEFKEGSLCSKLNIPQDHKTNGVPEADMVLYVTASPTLKGTFAWASTCATLGAEGRPVIGIINYSPRHIESTQQHIRVAAHEIAHALGFSAEEMVLKRMVKTGVTVRERPNIALVVSPNTRREAMAHYNCESMEGMELEDESPFSVMGPPGVSSGSRTRRPSGPQRRPGPIRPPRPGALQSSLLSSETQEASVQEDDIQQKTQGNVTESGFAHHVDVTQPFDKNKTIPRSHSLLGAVTANADGASSGEVVEKKRRPSKLIPYYSHWKRRNAKDELMVGLVGAGYYTALTMGAFADLGYYKVNWEKAEGMSWGNKAGCELLNEKCVKDGSTKFPNMFCTTEHSESREALRCTSDRQSLGSCNANSLDNDLASQYQYFSDAMQGGEKGSQMDFCPIITALPHKGCVDGEEGGMPGSITATNARCVEGKNLVYESETIGAMCVEMSCKFGAVSLRYRGDVNWYSCPEGENLKLQGEFFSGEIVCPKYADVCNTIDRAVDELQGPREQPIIHGVRGNDVNADGDVAAAILAPLLFIFLAVSTIMAP